MNKLILTCFLSLANVSAMQLDSALRGTWRVVKISYGSRTLDGPKDSLLIGKLLVISDSICHFDCPDSIFTFPKSLWNERQPTYEFVQQLTEDIPHYYRMTMSDLGITSKYFYWISLKRKVDLIDPFTFMYNEQALILSEEGMFIHFSKENNN